MYHTCAYGLLSCGLIQSPWSVSLYVEGSQVTISRYFHYLAFNHGLYYYLSNFTHLGVTDTIAGVIISSLDAFSDSSKRR